MTDLFQPKLVQRLASQLISQKISLLSNFDQQVLLNPALAAGYRVAICDESVSLPFVMDSELVRRASVFANAPLQTRPRLIFDYLCERISYGTQRRRSDIDYAAGMEVWKNKQGICGEMTYLYVSMARFAGLRANYASVRRDYTGKSVQHACALVQQQNSQKSSRSILVDLAYRKFDIAHKSWKQINDEQVWELFKSWR